MTRHEYLTGVNLYLDWLEDDNSTVGNPNLKAFDDWEKKHDRRETVEVRITASNIFQQIDN